MSCILGWLKTHANMQIYFWIILDNLGYTLNDLFHPHPDALWTFFCKQSLEQHFQNSQGPRNYLPGVSFKPFMFNLETTWIHIRSIQKLHLQCSKLSVINFYLWLLFNKYAQTSPITKHHTHRSWRINFCFLFFGVIVQRPDTHERDSLKEQKVHVSISILSQKLCGAGSSFVKKKQVQSSTV